MRNGRGTGPETNELMNGLPPPMISLAAEIFDVLIDPVGGEVARLEVGNYLPQGLLLGFVPFYAREIEVSEHSLKQSCRCRIQRERSSVNYFQDHCRKAVDKK